ncbi:Uu.00g129340.m01.CDS01 [Anthostomella pinea]|uniref:Uu.00g129340.m01.CDS01 n=1 Tax=Anthostomella pinea TaxID=933095 RepID=A0AAI8VIH5_9PEZI|nr:Uu.00g129340.m01.CDS01 [Anthostomella pinea]
MKPNYTALCGVAIQALATTASPVGRLLGSSFGIPGTDTTYDYVIVGGGTAGLTVATRLVEQNAGSVAIIEAGTFYELGQSNISQVPADTAFYNGKDPDDWQPRTDWGYVTTPQAGAFYGSLHYPRAKMLGGCSGRNYMIYHRATSGAYDKWADTVEDPSYAFDSFLPYLEKSVNFTGPNADLRLANATPSYDISALENGEGPLSVTYPNYAYAYATWAVNGLKEIGLNVRQGFQNGELFGQSYSMFTINADTMLRESSETAFLRSSLDNTNYYLYDLTMAKKVIFNGTTATGVLVDTLGREYTISARKEVIVSSGSIGSPQLLQASGVGPSDLLNSLSIPVVSDLPGVGQNFQDHILFGVTHRVNSPTASSLSGDPAYAAEQSRLFLQQAAGALTSPATDVLAFEKLPNNTRAALSNTTRAVLDAEYPADWPEVEYISLAAYMGDFVLPLASDPDDGHNYAALAVVLCKPRSRGSVNITSADTSVHPALNPGFLTDRADVEVAVAGFKRARQFWATKAMAVDGYADPEEAYPGAEAVQTDAEIENSIRRSFQTIFHGAATCAMGPAGDPKAVVDPQARVYGVQGLRVVDASAMPFLPPGHPQSTIYALAEKIACDISGNC